MGTSESDGEITFIPGFECEVGQILNVSGFGNVQRVKVTNVEHKVQGMTIHWTEMRSLTRDERRGKNRTNEPYYRMFA